MHTFSEKRRILPNLFFEWGRGKEREGGEIGEGVREREGSFFPWGKVDFGISALYGYTMVSDNNCVLFFIN